MPYGQDYPNNGSPYYNNANTTPQMMFPGNLVSQGPWNGIINTIYEGGGTSPSGTLIYPATTAFTNQVPSNANGGRFLMFWTDNQYTDPSTNSTATCPPGNVWCKSYATVIGQNYRYSYKSVSANGAFPELQAKLNGVNLGSQYTVTNPGNWVTFYIQFVATSTTADICLYNSQTATLGNDLFLDDIRLETYNFAECNDANVYPLVNVAPFNPGNIPVNNYKSSGNNILVDSDLTNYQSTFSSSIATVESANVNNPAIKIPAGAFAGFVIDKKLQDNTDITLSMITIATTLNGVDVEQKSGSDLQSISVAGSTTLQNVGFITTMPFNGIRIAIAAGGFSGYKYYYANYRLPCDPLPVVFSSFDAYFSNGDLIVNWSTSNDMNVDHFIIETSNDGISFIKIGTIQSKATSISSANDLNYTFTTQSFQIALTFGGIAFVIFAFSLLYKKNRTLIGITTIVIFSISFLFIQSCSKSDGRINKVNSKKVFIRIVEVSKNGGFSYSKVIEARRVD